MKFKYKKPALNYLILTAFLFFFFYIGDLFFNLTNKGFIFLFIFWFVSIAISESIIKYVFKI